MNTGKALMFLAIVVLLSGLSGVALANEQGMLSNDSSEYSPSADPSWPPAQTDVSQIREPVEAGAVPDRPESSSDMHSNAAGDEPTVEIGGLRFRTKSDLP